MSDSSLRTPLRINAISSTPISSKRAITNIQSYLESSQARSGGDSAIRTRLDKLSSALKAEKHTSKQVCAHWRGQTHASSSHAYVVELRSGRIIRQEGGSLAIRKGNSSLSSKNAGVIRVVRLQSMHSRWTQHVVGMRCIIQLCAGCNIRESCPAR